MGKTNKKKLGELLDSIQQNSTGKDDFKDLGQSRGHVKYGIRDDARTVAKLTESVAVHKWGREPSYFSGENNADGIYRAGKRISFLNTLIESGGITDYELREATAYLKTHFDIEINGHEGSDFKLSGSILYSYGIPFILTKAARENRRPKDLLLIGIDTREYSTTRFESNFDGSNPDKHEINGNIYYPVEAQGMFLEGLNTGNLRSDVEIQGPSIIYDGENLSEKNQILDTQGFNGGKAWS